MSIRALIIVDLVLALGELRGVVVGDMHLRYVGFIGHAGAFPVASLLMASVFPQRHRTNAARASAF